jgi:hypothetical protein
MFRQKTPFMECGSMYPLSNFAPAGQQAMVCLQQHNMLAPVAHVNPSIHLHTGTMTTMSTRRVTVRLNTMQLSHPLSSCCKQWSTLLTQQQAASGLMRSTQQRAGFHTGLHLTQLAGVLWTVNSCRPACQLLFSRFKPAAQLAHAFEAM